MNRINSLAQQIRIWRENLFARPFQWLQLPIAAWLVFRRKNCRQQAAALTFNSLLALVPLLAIMFALLKGFGVHNKIEPLLLSRLSSGSEEVVRSLILYINNTNVAQLGTVGLITLLLTVLFLLTGIEKAFNELWQVSETRSWFRRFADYFSVVSFGPLFLFVAISVNTSLQSQKLVQWMVAQPWLGDAMLLFFEWLPAVVIWVAFIFLYLFMPNTRVTLSSAMVGGACSSVLWLLVQWVYVTFQVGVARYNAIYGTMAALPVFMMWIYLSWLITLFGVVVCWVWQRRRQLVQWLPDDKQEDCRPLSLLILLLQVYRRFQDGQPPWKEQELFSASQLAQGEFGAALALLQRGGILIVSECEKGQSVVLPCRDAAAVALDELLLRDLNQSTTDPALEPFLVCWKEAQQGCLKDWNLSRILNPTRLP
ncbi:MAG: YihY/virulence factor BrkB family protein [Desulfuromonadaceae bacterium]|nr:YihY/virulence factor BrkB family protein [Desulfuromonadaceae bacterium]